MLTALKKKHKPNPLVLILVLSAILIASLAWGAWAKYFQQRDANAIVKAKEFYFTSDYLTEKGAAYTLNPGTKSFTFELRNYDDLKVSELDIAFTVKVNGVDFDSGTLSCRTSTAEEITLSDLVGGSTYVITAMGTNGYEQNLSATVYVKPDHADYHVETENRGEYLILTIWTENASENLVVTIPHGLIPDWTDDALHGKVANGTFTVDLDSYQSRSYRFFTTSDYSGGAFSVTAAESRE